MRIPRTTARFASWQEGRSGAAILIRRGARQRAWTSMQTPEQPGLAARMSLVPRHQWTCSRRRERSVMSQLASARHSVARWSELRSELGPGAVLIRRLMQPPAGGQLAELPADEAAVDDEVDASAEAGGVAE